MTTIDMIKVMQHYADGLEKIKLIETYKGELWKLNY